MRTEKEIEWYNRPFLKIRFIYGKDLEVDKNDI
jgi:hypothetical protein